MQPEQNVVDNQAYACKFCGKELMGNQDLSDTYSTQDASYGNYSPRFQCTCLTDPITEFLREVWAVK